eukprot:gene6864-7473_t
MAKLAPQPNMDAIYEKRAESLLGVDEMIGALLDE